MGTDITRSGANRNVTSKATPGSTYNITTYRYGRVVGVDNTTKIIQYEPITDNYAPSGLRVGLAYPHNVTSGKVPSIGSIVPLTLGPPPEGIADLSRQYDQVVLYHSPISVNQTVNDNTVKRGDSFSNSKAYLGDFSISNYKKAAEGINPNINTPPKTILEEYLPAYQRAFPSQPKGIGILMAAQASLEGFGKKSNLNYRTKNPGNVSTCTDCKPARVTEFSTLDEGIKAQWDKVLSGAFTGKSKYYKSNMTLLEYLYTYAPPYYMKGGEKYSSTNDPIAYTSYVIGYFKYFGVTITASTTLEQIRNIS